MKKHRALSKRSLGIVLKWCEKNETTPLAVAYSAACCAVYDLDPDKISDQLRHMRKGKDIGYIGEAYKLYELSIIYRDTIGRIIFDLLKR